ncbi:MAG: 50S ribosomal protein L18 [Candidatus Eisenbacteria bacterium]|uniref:Large ribosomal subunit protein uL18 n=1 Tax=Eiseniibacteriota bacterium TaxID=2212470 RepID=A0A948W6H6_UNCEI|nr:50S ribosomal protein L18 [Candidatus Eisenbacteria bacterium]MBU1950602.1 50S ribosomal protein L18 [Candidatus Eisenbacteria bacterium]MBU2691135.1 50S ribosomal protein L18 [Candidatus Eisenbacteria bacterium]
MAVSLRRLERKEARSRRHRRIRKRVHGTAERPRLCVVRSLKHIYAQIIDDDKGVVLFGCSTLSPAIREIVAGIKPIEAGKEVGKLVAKMASERGIKNVSFDRGGCIYCGRVKAVAEGAREGKLEF